MQNFAKNEILKKMLRFFRKSSLSLETLVTIKKKIGEIRLETKLATIEPKYGSSFESLKLKLGQN